MKRITRENSLWLIVLLFSVFLASTGLYSCTDEVCPETATETNNYYVSGIAIENGVGVPAVLVSIPGTQISTVTGADGTFQLSVPKTGEYKVSFSKAGYVSVTAEAAVNSNTKVNTLVGSLIQSLTKINREITPRSDTDHEEALENVILNFPKGVLTGISGINVTEYIEGGKIVRNGALTLSLATLNCLPDGTTFRSPVMVNLKNPIEDQVTFKNISHFTSKNNMWSEIGATTFDKAANLYITSLTGFSEHSFRIASTGFIDGVVDELLDTKIIDNCGITNIAAGTLTVKQKYGWDFDGDIEKMLKDSYPTLTDKNIQSLVKAISSAISSYMGSKPRVGQMNLRVPYSVSGYTSTTMKFIAEIQKSSMTFPLIFADGTLEWFHAPVKRYIGTRVESSSSYCSTTHSGGGGQ